MIYSERPDYIIQSGSHEPRVPFESALVAPFNVGISKTDEKAPLSAIVTDEVIDYLNKHLAASMFGAQCRLGGEIPSGSDNHTPLHFSGITLPQEKVAVVGLVQARLLSLGHTAVIDPKEYKLYPRIGIGLFFWKTVDAYQFPPSS